MNKERELAIKILGEFEDFLEVNHIWIHDEDREGKINNDEARIYGTTYYNLEDKITNLIKKRTIIKQIKIMEVIGNGN